MNTNTTVTATTYTSFNVVASPTAQTIAYAEAWAKKEDARKARLQKKEEEKRLKKEEEERIALLTPEQLQKELEEKKEAQKLRHQKVAERIALQKEAAAAARRPKERKKGLSKAQIAAKKAAQAEKSRALIAGRVVRGEQPLFNMAAKAAKNNKKK